MTVAEKKKMTLKELLTSDVSSLRSVKSKDIEVKKTKSKKSVLFPKEYLAIDIGSSSIKMALGKEKGNKLYVSKLVKVDNKSFISDGVFTDKSKVGNEIINVLLQEGIKNKEVNFTGNSSIIINRELVIPKASEEELNTLIEYEIQKYLPINMHDYIIQYDILEELKVDDMDKLKVLVVTYPNKLAKDYYDLSLKIGLKPNALDVRFNSVKKLLLNNYAFNGKKVEAHETVALVDMGAENIDVSIFKHKVMDFTRIIKVGSSAINTEGAKALKLPEKDVEMKKLSISKNPGTTPEEEILQGVVNQFIDTTIGELQRLFQFYRNKAVGNKIDKVFIYGGGSRIKDIDIKLSEDLNTKVIKVNSLDNIVFKNEQDAVDVDLFINALGALIRL